MSPTTRVTRTARTAGYVAALLVVPALAVWATGRPFVFPSLGPTAYVLGTRPGGDHTARRVVGGHAVGVLAGLVAFHAVAAGADVSLVALGGPLSPAGARLAVSGVLAVGLTTAGMLIADAVHAPACATTLIVSLGVLPAPADGAIVLGSVLALYGTHRAAEPVRTAGRPLADGAGGDRAGAGPAAGDDDRTDGDCPTGSVDDRPDGVDDRTGGDGSR